MKICHCGGKEDIVVFWSEEFKEESYLCQKCMDSALEGYVKQPIKEIICPVCQKPFLPKKKLQRLCSKRCAGLSVGKQNAK